MYNRYDDAKKEVSDTQKALDDERRDTRRRLQIPEEVKFFGKFKHRYQLEIPRKLEYPMIGF